MTSTPPPLHPGITGTPGTQNARRAIVRRARIEHLALELLRLADAVRLPVPVDGLWRFPPENLWPTPHDSVTTVIMDEDNPYLPRYNTAREIAKAVIKSSWETRQQLIGDRQLDDEELDAFAVALLMPTPLFTTLSDRQKRPEIVATIFQVPLPLAEKRLRELGYF